MKVCHKLLFTSILMLIALSNTYVETNAQTNLTIWLAVDDDTADAIETTLGSTYTYERGSPLDLADDLNRRNILGTLPDLIIGLNDAIPNLAVKNVIQPIADERINGIIPNIERQASFYRVNQISDTQARIVADSAVLYGYPISASSTFIFANEDLVDLNNNDFSTFDGFETTALFSNDQSNPTNKIFGFGLDSILDPMLWMYYANDGRIFTDDILDLSHLIINEPASIDALGAINQLVNVQRLIPQDSEDTVFQQFAVDQNLAMLIGELGKYQEVKSEPTSTLDISKVKLFAVPGGAPVHSYNVMVSTSAQEGSLEEVKTIFETLTTNDFQSQLFDFGQIPVSNDGYNAITQPDEIKNELIFTVENGLALPIDTLWADVSSAFENQLSKLYTGDQNHTRTALASEIDIRILLSETAQWGPLPTLTGSVQEKSTQDDSPFILEFWMVAPILGYIFLAQRRKITK